ncbi:protein starmaker-like [Ranitomeya imitator]|uniref:protein starmaker-like n=1 Tax=Ranitomeya imitator TaxID=111125 RepID=UPI0037E80E48
MAYHSKKFSNYSKDIWRKELSPGFKEVILRSNAVPQGGRIYVMYHGTTFSAAEDIIENGFEQSVDGMLGPGVYVSRDISKALRYPLYGKSRQVVLKLRVSVGKVKKINYRGHPLQKTWHEHGYDTAWLPPNCGMVNSELEEDCVWDPRRIKVEGIAKASKQHMGKLKNLLIMQQSLSSDESYKGDKSDRIYQSDKKGIYKTYKRDESDARDESDGSGASDESDRSNESNESDGSDESDGSNESDGSDESDAIYESDGSDESDGNGESDGSGESDGNGESDGSDECHESDGRDESGESDGSDDSDAIYESDRRDESDGSGESGGSDECHESDEFY